MGLRDRLAPRDRKRTARLVVLVTIATLLAVSAAETAAYTPPRMQPGTIDDPAEDETIIAVQGYNIGGDTNPNKPARLVSVGPAGEREWVLNRTDLNTTWFYDVDPLPNGDLLVVGTLQTRQTRVFRVDRETREVIWKETLPLWDTHDVTLTEAGNLLVANMRNTNNGTSDDRVFVYNRTTDEIEWEWYFKNHYPANTDKGISASDWTHVNDVDVIAPGLYMLSPRNFDQVIVVNRSTKAIVMKLGCDDCHEILNEQHNPAYLQSENGTPTFLVADSGNDRVVEYQCDQGDPDHPLDGDMKPNCEWTKTWEVGTGQLDWPRDADRLPNGNTLIVDTLNQRVIEVTPQGRIVWEYYAPWIPFDAERPTYGQEAGGPTMADLNASGTYTLSGSAKLDPGQQDPLTERIDAATDGFPGAGIVHAAMETYEGSVPWVRPIWMSPDGFFLLVVALLVGLAWGSTEAVLQRRQLRRRVGRLLDRIRTDRGAS